VTGEDVPREALRRLREPARAVAGPVAIVLAGALMFAWSYQRWPDLLIDFGRELYVAWRVSAGERLYADVAYLNGPLSPYLNGLCFRIFGVGIDRLVAQNLVLLAAATAVLYRLLAAVSDRLCATVACLVLAFVFAFGQLDSVGNYNYLTPYSHDLTHGLFLSLGALLAFSTWPSRGTRALWAAGLCLGLALLTKVEVSIAAAFALCAGVLLRGRAVRASARDVARSLLALWLPALGVVGAALLLLSLAMPARVALRGIAGPWLALFDPRVTGMQFYRWGQGTLFFGQNLRTMLAWTAGWAALFGGLALLDRIVARRPRLEVAAAAGAALALLLFLRLDLVRWLDLIRPLPLVVAVLGALALASLRRGSDDGRVLRATLLVFAFGLLGKILFRVRFQHYAFALAMPATLLTVVALVGWIPARLRRAGGSGAVFRAGALAAIAVAVLSLLQVVDRRYAARVDRVGSGADAFWSGPPAKPVKRVMEHLSHALGEGETLAVLPEGAMINYLLRRVNPTGHVNFMPPEIAIFGEEEILERFRQRPPDRIVLVHKDTSIYGYPLFGRDYARRLYAWIQERYAPEFVVGSPPLRERGRFGIAVLAPAAPQRRPDAGARGQEEGSGSRSRITKR
jgi:hypothetical protein